MKPDMSLQNLATLVPKTMPEGVCFRLGDKVLVRFMRRANLLHRATVVDIFDPVSGERMTSVEPSRGEMDRLCIKVEVEGDEHTQRPVWPFQDHIYSYEWVNDWAGMEVAKPPEDAPKRDGEEKRGIGQRLKRLFGSGD